MRIPPGIKGDSSFFGGAGTASAGIFPGSGEPLSGTANMGISVRSAGFAGATSIIGKGTSTVFGVIAVGISCFGGVVIEGTAISPAGFGAGASGFFSGLAGEEIEGTVNSTVGFGAGTSGFFSGLAGEEIERRTWSILIVGFDGRNFRFLFRTRWRSGRRSGRFDRGLREWCRLGRILRNVLEFRRGDR